MGDIIKIRHFIAGLSGCKNNFSDPEPLATLIKTLLKQAGLHVVGEIQYKDLRIYDGGASCCEIFIPLKESHCIVHTFPDQRFAEIDMGTCENFTDSAAAYHKLVNFFQPEKVQPYLFDVFPE